ncbi:F-box/WD repeat-containing protein 7-like [Trematomus bernacchii]|uniref:F-box/WD repeat-containing protein 7-like n=1 Tax=Trematomus bernacchii TaxID=40690 RepID=UPI00146DC139|nr:F-box/WD repeat-containing protein 7-like [Trematomus bernacchii]
MDNEHQERREEEEEEMMKAGKVINGHTPIFASSSLTSFPFLSSSSLCRGREEDEEEVSVAIVTIDDESCPSEPFGPALLETANQIARIEGGGDKEEEEEEERNSEEEEMTSPSPHLSLPSPASLVQATTPTTFGDLRLANGLSAQRRRVTSGPPPSGLQDWLHIFQAWSGPERLLALDELIDRCETGQVKHMMQVIEPQFQRDFISLLPKELALYVLTFLAPKDLLQAAQTCRYWRILAEDNLLWREKCREEGTLKSPDDFDGAFVVSGSLDTSIRVWDAETGGCVHTLTGHQSLTSGMELRENILVSGNADSTVRVWDIQSGKCLHTLQGPNKHQSAVTCLQFCRGLVLSSSDDGTVKLWDLKTGSWVRDVVTLQSRGAGGVVWRIRASDTRLVCAAGSRNGTEETKLLVLDFDLDDRTTEEE